MKKLLCLICLIALPLKADILTIDTDTPQLREKLMQEQPPRATATALRTETAPTLDGKLDEACWQAAKSIVVCGVDGYVARARMSFDDDALYVAVVCEQKDPPVIEYTQRDSDVYKDDCIEVWIGADVRGRGSHQYQFDVNAAGAQLDLENRDRSFSPPWSTGVDRQGNNWTVEMSLPWTSVQYASVPADIPFNIGRNGPALTPQSWTGRYGSASSGKLILNGVVAVENTAETTSSDDSTQRVMEGEGFRVLRAHQAIDAGERYAFADVELDKGATLTAALLPIGAAQPAAEVAGDARAARIWVDLREADLSRARLVLRAEQNGKAVGAAELLLSAADAETTLDPARRIAVMLDTPLGLDVFQPVPVTFGFPVPRGALWSADALSVVDAAGNALPSQTEVTGRWARDGAVRWVRVDALVDPSRGAFVVNDAKQATGPKLTLQKQGDKVTVDTGVAQYTLSADQSPIESIKIAGRTLATSRGARGLYVIDQNGRVGTASATDATVEVESAGPVAASVRIEGNYTDASGEAIARHITRVELFAGQIEAKVQHTLVLIHDTNETWLSDVGWEMSISPGGDAVAAFNTSRTDWRKRIEQPLSAGSATVSMFQDDHVAFHVGENHFSVVDHTGRTIAEGEECGDWAAVRGRSGGLVFGCRDAARQHPKEFVVGSDKIDMKLFSSRAGEAMDFRVDALAERWDVDNMIAHGGFSRKGRVNAPKNFRKMQSNAVGWSKTHNLVFAPLSGNAGFDEAATIAKHHCDGVFALIDPHWLKTTDVFGPLHPRDVDRFGPQEQVIEGVCGFYNRMIDVAGEWGFVDYWAGPHIGYRPGGYILQRRYSLTYNVRSDLWTAYARSGNRMIRHMAHKTNRTYMDSYMCRWDGNDKIRGLFIYQSGSRWLDAGDAPESYPMYWQGLPVLSIGGSTNLGQFEWGYQLTGDRRLREAVTDYGQGLKRKWSMHVARREWRQLRLLLTATQCYEATWDEAYRIMAEVTTDILYEPNSNIRLSIDKPYGSTYKTQSDFYCVWMAQRVFRDPRLDDMLDALAVHWKRNRFASFPLSYGHPSGLVSVHQYDKGDLSVAPAILRSLEIMPPAFDVQSGTFPEYRMVAADMKGVFQTLPYGMHVIAASEIDRKPIASRVLASNPGTRVYFRKPSRGAVKLHVKDGNAGGGRIEPQLSVRQVSGKPIHAFTLVLNEVTTRSGSTDDVLIPLDASAGIYELSSTGSSLQVYADGPVPMVIHAPEGLEMALPTAPAVRVIFRVPADAGEVTVDCDKPVQLIGPDGKPADAVTGPGLWTVAMAEGGTLNLQGAPPVFAFDHKAFYFDLPEIEQPQDGGDDDDDEE